MSLPPFLARVQIHRLTLWLPLFLLWPLVAILIVPAFFVGAIAALVITGVRFDAYLRAFAGSCRLLCELSGTVVSVEAPHARVSVALY